MKHEVTSLNTKKMFANALKEKMKTKSFSKITVSEIISACHVNRKTFYYHFTDLYDLLNWIFQNEAVEVVKHFDLLIDYKEAIQFVINYIKENEYLINCAFDSIGRDEMKRFFVSDFLELTLSIINSAEMETGVSLSEEYKQFLCSFYTEALAGMLVEWIKNRQQYDEEQIAEYIHTTIKMSLIGILQSQKDLE